MDVIRHAEPQPPASHTDAAGNPVGRPVEWTPRSRPEPVELIGRYAWVGPLTDEHVPAVYAALHADRDWGRFTYLGFDPFPDEAGFAGYVQKLRADRDWCPFALGRIVAGQRLAAEGMASLLRINESDGSVEVGGIAYGPGLRRTTAATEVMYLLARYVFDELGYRRYEWKCDDLNAPSRRAAVRLGFRYEGTFRNALVYKGRNRDTAWYAMTDDDWPGVKAAFERWLDDANQGSGVPTHRLADLRG